ncbi:hypothetical protein IKG68_02865 [Candidatus Saccharibacteria bacterium]|nr:hypothetical protein [Candidatus Saccharibacteria bacterium]MBR3386483.1 hypothetical protein [Candidatus Saccharibacteria bacterium]
MATKLHPVSWEAEEYIVKSHNAGWYVGLAFITLALSALAIWLQGWTFLALILVSALTILIFALRPPRTIKYRIDNQGITEGTITHHYSDFRAFGLLQEGEHYSAVLIPKKRFAMSVKIYFPEGSGEGIVDYLGNHLPMEPVKLDLLDKLVNFLRI